MVGLDSFEPEGSSISELIVLVVEEERDTTLDRHIMSSEHASSSREGEYNRIFHRKKFPLNLKGVVKEAGFRCAKV